MDCYDRHRSTILQLLTDQLNHTDIALPALTKIQWSHFSHFQVYHWITQQFQWYQPSTVQADPSQHAYPEIQSKNVILSQPFETQQIL